MSRRASYFTVECNTFTGTAFLCGCSPEGSHLNYGPCGAADPASPDYVGVLAAEERRVAKMARME